MAGQPHSVTGPKSQTQSDHGEDAVEPKDVPVEASGTQDELLSGQQLFNFAEKSVDRIKPREDMGKRDEKNLTRSTVLLNATHQSRPPERENTDTVIQDSQTTQRGQRSAAGEAAIPVSISPPPGREAKPHEVTREPIKLKQ